MLGIGDSSLISLNLGDNSALDRFNQPTNSHFERDSPLVHVWPNTFCLGRCSLCYWYVFKGESNEKTEVVLKTWKVCKQFYLHGSFCCSVKIYKEELCGLLLLLAIRTSEEQKKPGLWRIWYCCHICRPWVYDVAVTDYWEQNSSTNCRVFATFKRQLFNKQDQKRVKNSRVLHF